MIGSLYSVYVPMIRREMPTIIASAILDVQPLQSISVDVFLTKEQTSAKIDHFEKEGKLFEV